MILTLSVIIPVISSTAVVTKLLVHYPQHWLWYWPGGTAGYAPGTWSPRLRGQGVFPGESGCCWWLVSCISPQTHPAHPWDNRERWEQSGTAWGSPGQPPASPFFPHSPACPRTWDPAHTRGCVGWCWARFLRPCLRSGGTWTSRIPSCGREKGDEPSLLWSPQGGVFDAGLETPVARLAPLPMSGPLPHPHLTELTLPLSSLGFPTSTSATHPYRADKLSKSRYQGPWRWEVYWENKSWWSLKFNTLWGQKAWADTWSLPPVPTLTAHLSLPLLPSLGSSSAKWG